MTQAIFVYMFAILLMADSFLDNNDDCRQYTAYRDLASLLEHDDCRSVVSVIKTLHQLISSGRQIHCGKRIIEELAKRYSFDSRTPTSCFCNGTMSLHHYNNHNRRYSTCHQYHSYRVLYDRFFDQQSSTDAPDTPCRSHHSVWYELNNVHGYWSNSYGGYSRCLTDIINHVYDYYNDQRHSDPCSCTANTAEATRCIQYESYNKLVQYMENSQGCVSMNKDKFNNSNNNNGILCLCGGHVGNFDTPRIGGGNIYYCERSSAYKDLERKSFSNVETYGCRSLKETWPFFVKIQDYNLGCQTDYIKRAASHYKTELEDPCTCQLDKTLPIPVLTTLLSSTKPPTVSTDSTTTASTRPSSSISTNTEPPTTKPTIKYTCNKFNTIEAVAQGLPVNSSSDKNCVTSLGSSLGETNDNVVTSFCNAPSPQNWSRGVKVMDHCQTIPTYTPIAAFNTDIYSTTGASSGIFIGCEPDGFRVILQPCSGVPTIQHFNSSGVFLFDPNNYYVIV